MKLKLTIFATFALLLSLALYGLSEWGFFGPFAWVSHSTLLGEWENGVRQEDKFWHVGVTVWPGKNIYVKTFSGDDSESKAHDCYLNWKEKLR